MDVRRCCCFLLMVVVVVVFGKPTSEDPAPVYTHTGATPASATPSDGDQDEGRTSAVSVADVLDASTAEGEANLSSMGNRDALLEVLTGMERVFHFVDEVEKNDLLSEELVDKSWLHWMTTRINSFVEILQDPNKSLWDAMTQMMIRSERIGYIDKSETGDVDVTVSNVMFDPLGSIFKDVMHTMESMPMFYSIKDWWERVRNDINRFADIEITGPLIEKVVEEPEQKYPDGVLSIAPYDPLVVGVNTLIKWGFHFLFLKYLLFTSGWENMFLGGSVVSPLSGVIDGDNYDYYDEEFEEFLQGDDDGDGDDEGDVDGDGDGDGGGGGGPQQDAAPADYDYNYDYGGGQAQYDYYGNNDYAQRRRPRPSSYSYLYYDPSYTGRSGDPARSGDVNRSDDPGRSSSDTRRSDDPPGRSSSTRRRNDSSARSDDSPKKSSSNGSPDYIYGNTYGHGVGGPHVALTLPDANLYGKKK